MSLAPNFIDVQVNLPAVGVAPQNFNVGLIIGDSAVISAGTRVETFASLNDMIDAGFSASDPEYLAAALYFAAPSQPNLVAIGRKDTAETSLEAITACRLASSVWYAAYDATAVDADQAGISAYVETQTAPFSQYFMQSSTTAIKAGTGGNLFETLKGSGYSRSHGMFSSSPHAVASIMGYAMGQTSNLAGSVYTLKFKNLVGATPETLTESQVTAIENNYGNVFVNRTVNMYEQGRNFSGQFFDEVIGLDMLSNDISVNVTNLLYGSNSVPQTEGGVAQLRTVISQACETAVTRGFIAPGQWSGPPVLTLKTGDYLPSGYLVLSDSIDDQSTSDRTNRIAPGIYVPVKLAGSMHSVILQVNVNR